MTLEQVLTVLAIIVLSIILIAFIAIITGAILLKRKLTRVNKAKKLMKIGFAPTAIQLVKLYLRRRTYR